MCTWFMGCWDREPKVLNRRGKPHLPFRVILKSSSHPGILGTEPHRKYRVYWLGRAAEGGEAGGRGSYRTKQLLWLWRAVVHVLCLQVEQLNSC